jgi:lipopolysaccharide/colanic/teichoic acid biosynthesis glycosyltransferase
MSVVELREWHRPADDDTSATPRPLRTLHPERPHMRRRRRKPIGGVAKRALDIAVSSLALLVVAPIIAMAAIAIRLESKGPTFFVQRRGGFAGRTFCIYKLRTMRTTDDGSTVTQAARQDTRVTCVGKLLRKTSIDELPQIFNVLRGDMSLVGPRPHAVAHDRDFVSVDPLYSERWQARPGLTGWAQINGCRGPLPTPADVQKRTQYDLEYIRDWSLELDVKVLIRTALVVWGDSTAF